MDNIAPPRVSLCVVFNGYFDGQFVQPSIGVDTIPGDNNRVLSREPFQSQPVFGMIDWNADQSTCL
jgi:hypothetical protein